MNRKQKKILARILVTAALLVILHFVQAEGWLRFGLYLIPNLLIGYDMLRKAGKGIRNRQVFDENFRMAVATVGAMILGDYKEGTAVMLFYQIGELFQSYAVGRSRRNISQLMDIRPDYANIEGEDGELHKVDPDEVAVGTVIVVRPGERVPLDGVVVEGASSLNTVALTGESVPRRVTQGDEVLSGCVNLSGVVRMEVRKAFGESTATKIIELVERSSQNKSKSETFIHKFAHVYTPIVVVLALALARIPPFFMEGYA